MGPKALLEEISFGSAADATVEAILIAPLHNL